MNKSIYLHIPSENELNYHRYLISDEETMDYNTSYGDNGGCTYNQTAEQVRQWYQGWNKNSDSFYAYIVRTEDNAFIGEVNLHKSGSKQWYEMGIVLEAKYRGMGYSVPALKLLLRQAFEVVNAQAVHNDFEEIRISAIKTHLSAGFKEIKRENGIVELLITQEQYYSLKH